LSVFLANISLASAEQKAQDGKESAKQVTISTIHAAKGLEWPVVFIPACFEGSIPHSRADDNDEERRLLYVGMTRAQALLYLSCPIKDTQRQETMMSSFLTHSGAGSFFEEHGPSMPPTAVTSLSVTLRRDCPTATVIEDLKKNLERDEDNYWPLTGDEPFEEQAKWDRGRNATALSGFTRAKPAAWATDSSFVTMQQPQSFSTASATMPTVGFTSVSARFDELMEQAQLQKVDKRAEHNTSTKDSAVPALKGRKRQIDDQGSIANFFAKKGKPLLESATTAVSRQLAPASQPLRDVSSNANSAPTRQPMPAYKPRSTPMFTRPTPPSRKAEEEGCENESKYVFLSSSPPRPEAEEEKCSTTASSGQERSQESSGQMRPASTMHSTTMSMAKAAPQRRVLGMRRSLHGWPPAKRS
jgi:DNA helicase-2/ATP-dependent DNA helicase PcrA